MLDNVQITIADVHLRYEDRTNASTPCALGLRLASVQIKAIDEQGRTRFVERAPGKPVRKAAAIRNLSAYLEIGDEGWEARDPSPSSNPNSPSANATEPAVVKLSSIASASSAASSSSYKAKAPSPLTLSSANALDDDNGSAAGASRKQPPLLEPLSGRILVVFDTSRHRPPGVPACMAQIDFDVAAIRLTHAQYLAINDLVHYATHHRIFLSRRRHAARRPSSSPREAPSEWWRFAMAAALADFHTSIAPLNATLLKQRREYITAYHDSLLADMGGPPLSKHMQMRLVALERYSFSAGQVLAFRGLAAASAKPSLLALQRKLRAERAKARERAREEAGGGAKEAAGAREARGGACGKNRREGGTTGGRVAKACCIARGEEEGEGGEGKGGGREEAARQWKPNCVGGLECSRDGSECGVDRSERSSCCCGGCSCGGGG